MMAESTWPIASTRASRVRAPIRRRRLFISENATSVRPRGSAAYISVIWGLLGMPVTRNLGRSRR